MLRSPLSSIYRVDSAAGVFGCPAARPLLFALSQEAPFDHERVPPRARPAPKAHPFIWAVPQDNPSRARLLFFCQ